MRLSLNILKSPVMTMHSRASLFILTMINGTIMPLAKPKEHVCTRWTKCAQNALTGGRATALARLLLMEVKMGFFVNERHLYGPLGDEYRRLGFLRFVGDSNDLDQAVAAINYLHIGRTLRELR